MVGVPDARTGERCAAVVEPSAGSHITLGQTTAFLADSGVTKAFWPEELVTVDRMPRNDVGKWVRAEVSRLAADRLAVSRPAADRSGAPVAARQEDQ